MIRNRKAEEEGGLLGNTLGVVLALASTIIIIIFIYLVVINISHNPENEATKQVANLLEKKIEALSAGDSADIIVQGSTHLKDYYILGWGTDEQSRPDKCFFKSCICICKGTNADACQKTGICRDLDIEQVEVWHNKVVEEINVLPTGRHIDKSTPHIQISENFMVLTLNRFENEIEIRLIEPGYEKHYDVYQNE